MGGFRKKWWVFPKNHGKILLKIMILGCFEGTTVPPFKETPFDESIGSSATKHIAVSASPMEFLPCGTHCSGSGATKNKAWEMHRTKPSNIVSSPSHLCLGKSRVLLPRMGYLVHMMCREDDLQKLMCI